MEINPYAAPQSQVLHVTPADEETRKQHINTEDTMKSVGALYYLGAFTVTIVGLGAIGASINSRRDGLAASLFIGAVVLALGIGQGMLAHGLTKLRSWARIPTIILSSIGLLGFPVFTPINIYILVRISGEKGKFVFTPEYQRIIAATPHVKRETSMVAWVVLILLIILLLIGIITAAVLPALRGR